MRMKLFEGPPDESLKPLKDVYDLWCVILEAEFDMKPDPTTGTFDLKSNPSFQDAILKYSTE